VCFSSPRKISNRAKERSHILTTELTNMDGSTDSNGKGDGQKGKEVAADSNSRRLSSTRYQDSEEEVKGNERPIPQEEACADPDGTNAPFTLAPNPQHHGQIHHPNHIQSAYNQINFHQSTLHNPVFNQGTHNRRANQANGQAVNGQPLNGHVLGEQTPDGHGRRTDKIKTRAHSVPSASPSQHAEFSRRPSFRRAREWVRDKGNKVWQKVRNFRDKLRLEGFRKEVDLVLNNEQCRDI
jgi:hypothetical protein